MSEKYEKTCKYLNYVEHLLILALTITSCVFKCFFFASLVCVLVGITSSTVGFVFVQVLQESKSIRQLSRKKES